MPTRTAPRPFGASLSWMLINPIAAAHAKGIIRRLDLGGGMRVADVGCGVGRPALPIAEIVGENGEVVVWTFRNECSKNCNDGPPAVGFAM